jgi:cobalamin biosynthesis protein CobT
VKEAEAEVEEEVDEDSKASENGNGNGNGNTKEAKENGSSEEKETEEKEAESTNGDSLGKLSGIRFSNEKTYFFYSMFQTSLFDIFRTSRYYRVYTICFT